MEQGKNEVEENLELPEVKEGEEDATDWRAEAQKLRDKAIAQRERTKTLRSELKELQEFKAKAELEKAPKPEPKPEPKEEPKSNEPDYGKLAYLRSNNVIHEEDIKTVTDEATRLKLPISEVLQMEHITARLKKNREVREAKEGMPSGSNRSGSTGQQDVDYWVAKGGLPDNQELAEKVVDARMKQSQGSKFADEMFNE